MEKDFVSGSVHVSTFPELMQRVKGSLLATSRNGAATSTEPVIINYSGTEDINQLLGELFTFPKPSDPNFISLSKQIQKVTGVKVANDTEGGYDSLCQAFGINLKRLSQDSTSSLSSGESTDSTEDLIKMLETEEIVENERKSLTKEEIASIMTNSDEFVTNEHQFKYSAVLSTKDKEIGEKSRKIEPSANRSLSKEEIVTILTNGDDFATFPPTPNELKCTEIGTKPLENQYFEEKMETNLTELDSQEFPTDSTIELISTNPNQKFTVIDEEMETDSPQFKPISPKIVSNDEQMEISCDNLNNALNLDLDNICLDPCDDLSEYQLLAPEEVQELELGPTVEIDSLAPSDSHSALSQDVEIISNNNASASSVLSEAEQRAWSSAGCRDFEIRLKRLADKMEDKSPNQSHLSTSQSDLKSNNSNTSQSQRRTRIKGRKPTEEELRLVARSVSKSPAPVDDNSVKVVENTEAPIMDCWLEMLLMPTASNSPSKVQLPSVTSQTSNCVQIASNTPNILSEPPKNLDSVPPRVETMPNSPLPTTTISVPAQIAPIKNNLEPENANNMPNHTNAAKKRGRKTKTGTKTKISKITKKNSSMKEKLQQKILPLDLEESSDTSEADSYVNLMLHSESVENDNSLDVSNSSSSSLDTSISDNVNLSKILHQTPTIRRQLKAMLEEVEKDPEHKDVNVLISLMESTRAFRRSFLEKDNYDFEHGVKLFPALKDFRVIKAEYNALHPPILGGRMESLEAQLTPLMSNALRTKKRPGQNRHGIWERAVLEARTKGADLDPDLEKVLGMLCLCFHWVESNAPKHLFLVRSSNSKSQAERDFWKKISTPRLVAKDSELFSTSAKKLWIYAEGERHLKVPNVYQGVLAVYALHYIFNLQYEKGLAQLFGQFDELAGLKKAKDLASGKNGKRTQTDVSKLSKFIK